MSSFFHNLRFGRGGEEGRNGEQRGKLYSLKGNSTFYGFQSMLIVFRIFSVSGPRNAVKKINETYEKNGAETGRSVIGGASKRHFTTSRRPGKVANSSFRLQLQIGHVKNRSGRHKNRPLDFLRDRHANFIADQ